MERAQFIFAIYGRHGKEKTSFSNKISRLMKRLRFRSSTASVLDGATKVHNKVTASFSFNQVALPVTTEDVYDVQKILQEFTVDLCRLIAEDGPGLRSAISVTKRTYKFISDWNNIITSMDEQFLPGYGDIYTTALILTSTGLVSTLKQLKNYRKIPRQVKPLIDATVVAAISKSLEMHASLQTLPKPKPRRS